MMFFPATLKFRFGEAFMPAKLVDRSLSQAQTNQRLIARWIIRESIGVILVGVVLFLSAGTLDWLAGWAMVGLTLLWVVATGIVLIPHNLALLAERLGPKKGTKTWDTLILSLFGIVELVKLVVAGLDQRYAWSSSISVGLQMIMLLFAAAGYGMVVWATASNAYFAQTVRIQTERGHTVAAAGPYQTIRHPGYLGTIAYSIATPLMLGSWWALIPGGLGAILFILRTALEDQTLLQELPGYREYSQRVRYRLLPGFW